MVHFELSRGNLTLDKAKLFTAWFLLRRDVMEHPFLEIVFNLEPSYFG